MPSFEIEAQDAAFQSRSEAAPGSPAVSPTPVSRLRHAVLLLLLSLVAIAVNGYHPYGEDAAIYVAGIKQALHPGIYGSSAAFISPYFRLSLFPQCNAWMVQVLHISLPDLLFAMQTLTTWLLIYSLWELAKRSFQRREEQWGATMLATVCLSMPVAGSSLYLMDPYLNGRSFSTPFALLAIMACLDRRYVRAVLFLLLVAIFHPLMAIYATGFVLLLWAVDRRYWRGVVGLSVVAVGIGAVIQYSQRHVVESPAYLAAVVTRYYYFLYRWQWYEQVGVVAPLVLLVIYFRSSRLAASAYSTVLAKTCVIAGAVSITVSLLFARPSSRSHLISALQTIRPFLWIYICMFLLLGGLLGRYLLKRVWWRWVVFFVAAAAGTTLIQHQAYPASAQVELPWVVSSNGWNRAFVWIRSSTPSDALFALDADYIHIPGEDAQGFRAVAERNSLADLSKDGGAAAAFPELADRWMTEQSATTDLNKIDDAERLRRLVPLHVDWIVLDANSPTQMQCPFMDEAVKVCHLR